MTATDLSAEALPVLLYDARCGVCLRFVAVAVGADRRGLLRIAPLHGRRADQAFGAFPAFAGRDGAVWLAADGTATGHADAILATLDYLGGGWRVAARAFRIVPAGVRRWAYRTFASNRRFFGWLGLNTLDERSRGRLLAGEKGALP